MFGTGIKKIIISSVAAIALLPSVSAQAMSFEVDNDSNTYDNYCPNNCDNWKKISGQFGDARIHWGSSQERYHWKFSNPGPTGYYDFDIYLDNGNFTNYSASYYKDGSYLGGIDQNSADSGYTTLTWVWMGRGWNYDYAVSAYNSKDNTNTGADTIRFVD